MSFSLFKQIITYGLLCAKQGQDVGMKWARVGWGGQKWSGPFPLGVLRLNQPLSPAESKMSHIRARPELTQRSQCILNKESLLMLFSVSDVPTTLNNTDNQ